MKLRPTTFEFTCYRFEPEKKQIFFDYRVNFSPSDFILFTETVNLPAVPNLKDIPEDLYKKVLQDLHLALGISYYKLYYSRKIRINYSLSEEEAEFWDSFYVKGLGEFFFKNKLNPADFPGFKFTKKKNTKNYRIERNDKFLVGVSGGKDSIVAAELFKNHQIDFSNIYIETQKESSLVDNIIKKIDSKSFKAEGISKSFRIERPIPSLKIRRYLDEKIFDDKTGYYSGHVPISGIYAFLGILSAIFYRYSYFVVANEFSSNFGNVKYKGKTINHQWSKSYEFETSFQSYVKKFITPDVFYFSLLRPFYEIRIAETFANMKEYLYEFSSCNKNFKINPNGATENKLWCGKCPKCVFVFLILSPFLSKKTLINIFGSNLFLDAEILVSLNDILGFGRSKPFDCVGTYEEAKAAFYMSREKFREDLAGEIFLPKIDPDDNRQFFDEDKLPLKIYFNGQKKPRELIEKVFKTQPSAVPDHIKFLGMSNALILGYGKEGKITEKYLKKNFRNLEIGIADAGEDPQYLDKQKDYDIAIRSPGIAKENVKIPYTTATNIFFSYVRQIPGIKIIGVTGTKGKSTTASLIYHILKTSGKNVELLGNIGKPMLSVVLEKIKRDTIFVLELSSYQLDDIKYSPDIVVVTSLFPEHMDYHYNIKNYYAAKKNIIKYQSPGDLFIFNYKNKKMENWKKDATAKLVPFASENVIAGLNLPLVGEHNKENVRAAIAAVDSFNIPETVIRQAIESFKPLPHRLEFVGDFMGIKFFDDAISTTPESTIMAIKSLPKIGTILLGGQDRGYKFNELAKVVKKYGIKNVVLFPETGKKIFKSTKGLNVLETASMKQAVKFSYKNTPKGEICLLSCASPSYTLWKNFEEKGDQFKLLVKNFSEVDEKTL